MIRKGFISALIISGLSLVFLGSARALELNNSGNGAGSQNSIDLQYNQSTNVNQNNQGSFNNDINAGANTGGNSVSGGNGGSITTGDATVNVTVDNRFNSNQANVECCPDGKTPTPTHKPGQPTGTPTPTPPGGVGGPPGDGGDGDGGNGGGPPAGGVGGGQVIGLSAASGENTTELLITSTGLVCLFAGTTLLRKNHISA